jgi:benzoyl-CoA reductase/2-hydroxyglutaryl-CoA dehydratase subunit BcrC/BadD/HgdB
MVQLYENAREFLGELYDFYAEQKAEGKKLIGFFAHEFIPTALIRACGAVPVPLIMAGDEDRTARGANYLTPTMCPFALSQLGSFELREESNTFRFLKLLDGVIGTNYCAADLLVHEWITDLFDLKLFQIHIPFLREKHHIDFYMQEIKRFGEELAQFTEKPFELLNFIGELDRETQLRDVVRRILVSPIPGDDKIKFLQQATLYGSFGPTGFRIQDLTQFADNLQHKSPPKSSQSAVPLLFAGSAVFIGDGIYPLISESGGEIMFDITWLGLPFVPSYFMMQPDIITIKTPEDIYRYYAAQYTLAFASLHCAPDSLQQYVELIATAVKATGVKGVIYHILKFCDITGHHRQQIKEMLTERGIPVLILERDYSNSVEGQLRTRIEAFIEMIK